MTREELPELHYIAPFANMVSICQGGILSHRRAGKVVHQSVALEEVQARRRNKWVPGGRPLHEYVNLYICARNPMLFSLQAQHTDLCVLSVSTDVLDLPDVVVSDRNAASDYARFASAPEGLAIVDRDLAFAAFWTHADQTEEWRRKSIKCAEVLVPDRVEAQFIRAAYVASRESAMALRALLDSAQVTLPVRVNGHLFFR